MTSPGGGLVHVVDDEDAIRRSLDFLLRTAGYSVKRWATGDDFLMHADETVPACVLLDSRMPGIDGLEVLQRMTSHGLGFPVIMMTGHGDMELTLQAILAGVADFLEKPFDRERLLGSIASAFTRVAGHVSLRDEQAMAINQISSLTRPEREVLDGLACGFLKQTVADDLGLSLRTVEVYRCDLMTKLNVSYFADALRIAFKGGLGAEKDWHDKHRSRHKSVG